MAPATEERQEHGRSFDHVRSNPEGVAAVLWPLPRVGAQTGVAKHEPVPDPMADAQVQGAGRPQNSGCRDAQAAGARATGCVRSLVAGIRVVGWMMGAG